MQAASLHRLIIHAQKERVVKIKVQKSEIFDLPYRKKVENLKKIEKKN
ncbi:MULTISPECIES: hypothetical protein [Campylobacter]|nr:MULTISPECIES: hypothetical protein [unclassified Campylobacter]MCR8690888.1 hypothetical protein [Campylobacter sp. RM9264]